MCVLVQYRRNSDHIYDGDLTHSILKVRDKAWLLQCRSKMRVNCKRETLLWDISACSMLMYQVLFRVLQLACASIDDFVIHRKTSDYF